MRVWVIMGNDFPDGVCLSEEDADLYVRHKRKGEDKRQKMQFGPRIYWRHYEFEVTDPKTFCDPGDIAPDAS